MQSDVEVRIQILEILKRFYKLISTKNPQVLEEFVTSDEVLLIGSELGEIAANSQELASFFTRIFSSDATFSREWDRIGVSYIDNLAWFFADGRVVLSNEKDQTKSPYRITGILERKGERWLWK